MTAFSAKHIEGQLYASIGVDGIVAAKPQYHTGRPVLPQSVIMEQVRNLLQNAQLQNCVELSEGRVFLVPLPQNGMPEGSKTEWTLEEATAYIRAQIGTDLPLIIGTAKYGPAPQQQEIPAQKD